MALIAIAQVLQVTGVDDKTEYSAQGVEVIDS